MTASEVLSGVFVIILLWQGSYYVIQKEITPGELLSFYALIGYFTGPVASLVGVNKVIQNALIAAQRLFEIMDLELEETTEKVALEAEDLDDISFNEVNFSYGTRIDVFENFDATIKKGKVTAIVGESGSGKTTLISLLQNLYPLNGGTVRIGEYDLKHISQESLRKLIGVVPQNLTLFSGNVIDNIAFGSFEPDFKRILKLCKLLGMVEFIEKLPKGFQTHLGENGALLSGGQKQRIAIARALYKEPEIIIFDEATSYLDSASEKFIQNTMELLRNEGKTLIVIAHRLSTIVNADEILVLDKGFLIEQGKHTELLRLAGKYCEMWSSQFVYKDA
jgi:ATP-binding cassette subfamily B protein